MKDLYGLYPGEIEDYFTKIGERPYRAIQLTRWMYLKGVSDFDKMTDLSITTRQRLEENAKITGLSPEEVFVADDRCVKFLFTLDDGKQIESVIIPQAGEEGDDKITLCLSSQVGCPLGCTFCRTGVMGFVRDLTAGEILGQVASARQYLKDNDGKDANITNIVFMGMGEPLLNYDEVMRSVDILTADWGFGLSWRRITLSTAGIPPGILKMGKRGGVNLAVSLNATDDKLRSRIMPINRKYPISELMAALKAYPLKKGRRITIEYVLLKGVNDTPGHARSLVGLLKGLKVKVNLIPFNPFPGASFEAPGARSIEEFQETLIGAHINTIIRRSRGGAISAACGQLAAGN